MAQYKCEKCGLGGYSKNIRTRNFFPDDQLAAVLTNVCDVTTERMENGRRKVTLEFRFGDTDDNRPDDELEIQMVKNIQLSDETIRHWLCNHNFELVGGEEMV